MKHRQSSRPPLKRVIQRNSFGCGVASVACIGRISYYEARALFDGDRENRGINTRDITRALAFLKIRTGNRLIPLRGRNFRSLPFDAIVKTNRRNNGADWHWIVWDHIAGEVLDPLADPYQRYHAVSYLPVHW